MKLFVYGSLRRDAAGRHHPLMRVARFVAPATVRGRLYRVSWHPGLHLDSPSALGSPVASQVRGELFEFGEDVREAALAALTAYEGTMFRLEPVAAACDDGTTVDAFTWVWLGDAAEGTLRADGDWGAPAQHPSP
jgi:gamma-glutamylcyclotransferase (GGCT)/AIG2-like uncharacterized protein YtfP